MPELEETFIKGDAEFLAKYGFPKPAKDASNIVVGCRSGRRAVSAIQILEKIGYNSLMYVFHLTKNSCFLSRAFISTIRIYKESFNDWLAKGGPITKGH